MHAARERRVGEELHDARRAGRRHGAHDDRGPGDGRPAASDAAGVPGQPRPAVRLLHAGHGDGRGQPAEGDPEPERGAGPRGSRGQPLSLHRLPQHRAVDPGCGCAGGTSMTMVEEATGKVVGSPMKRREDPALLTGEARYTNDLNIPGALHLAVLRSPYAHARITSVDVSGALQQPGVVAAY